MPPLGDNNTVGSDKKTAALTFWVIRSCDSLKGPAIFTVWEDCSFYVDQNENDSKVDCAVFKSGIEALKYICPLHAVTTKNRLPTTTTTAAAAATAVNKLNSPPAASTRSKSKTITIDEQVKDTPLAAALRSRKRKATTNYYDDEESAQTTDPKRQRFQLGPKDMKWESKFQLFLDFQEEFGDPFLLNERIDSNKKYNVLKKWRADERARVRNYLRNPKTMSAKDTVKAIRLMEAGFTWESPKSASNWEQNYEEARAYKQIYGTLEMGKHRPGYKYELKKWIDEQQIQLYKYETPNEFTRLPNIDRAQKLRNLGIEPKKISDMDVPEDVKKVFEEKLKEVGEKRIAATQSFLNKNSTEVENPDKSTTNKKPSADGDQEGTNANSDGAAEPVKKVDKRWEENFAKLKEYKELYGTCDIIRNTAKHGRFSNLTSFVHNERFRIQRVKEQEKENPESVKPKDREKVRRLLDLGFVLEAGSEAKEQAKKIFKSASVWSEKRAALWETHYELLKQYKEKHGTCNVDRKLEGGSAALKKWARYQSVQLGAFEDQTKKCCLTEDRINRLKELGLERPIARRAGVLYSGPWEEMYEELRKFREMHGHAKVPAFPKSKLRNWVITQREHYLKMKQGKKSQMTQERLSKLLDLGLEMNFRDRKSFHDRAVEWLDYKTKHGRDPPTDQGALGQWVLATRRKYSLMEQGKETNLVKEEVDLLTQWGFTWKTGIKKPDKVAPRKSWPERFEELLQFKEQNGHVNVPQLYPILGSWVHRQRREFSLLKRGKKSLITPEQIEKLRSIGFVFLTRKSPLENVQKQREIELGLVAPDESEDEGESVDERNINLSAYW